MKIDIYTKVVLTVIGVALCALAWQGASSAPEAVAQAGACGSSFNPCHIEGDVQISFGFGESLKIRD